MNFSAPFIERPVATALLTVAIAIAGIAAFVLLPVAPLPNIDVPAVFVSASLPGASPQVMARTVATPLERRLGAIADVDDMTSTSSIGQTNIQLTFGLDRNLNAAARDVEAAIEAARPDLPAAMPHNPSYFKLNSSLFPVLALTMTSKVLTQGQIYDAADAVVSQQLAQIDGVGGVNVSGSALPAIRVEVNPFALAKYGIGLQDVRAAISNANANSPKGFVDAGGRRYTITTNDNARAARDYRNLIIAVRNGSVVRLSDVATVVGMNEGATENSRTYGIYDGKPAVSVLVFQQPGANVIKLVDAIKRALPRIRAEIDPKIDLAVIFDRSVTIRGSLRQIEQTLVIAIVMVILVVYAFIGSYRAALIPAVAVPVSLVGTFAAMYLLGYSLDNFSLMALTIATGFVVDDAIVVMENISRHIAAGVAPRQAALLGAQEVGFTVLAMSLSLIAVFLPFEFAGGIVGRLFSEFTNTLAIAILISLVVSLTTTPVMCARLLGGAHERPPSRLARGFARGFDAVGERYRRSLTVALDHPRVTILLLLATIGLNVYLYVAIPKGFFPQEDTGQLRGAIRGDATASFHFMKARLEQVTRVIQHDPAVAGVAGAVGGFGFGPSGGPLATMSITLKPLTERRASAEQVLDRLRPKFAHIPGIHVYLQSAQDIGTGGRSANAEYQYTLLGDNLQQLWFWSRKLRLALQHVPEVADVDSDLQPGGLQSDVIVDRDTASRLGLTESQIDETLGDAFAQSPVSTIYDPMNPQQYHVVMEIAPRYQRSPGVLRQLYVSTAGSPVSGTQATQSVAGTTTIAGLGRTPTATTAAAVAADAARNLATNALANAGRGNTSTAPAVSTHQETVVPLAAFAHFATSTAPVSVEHTGTSASTTIAFNLAHGASLGQALAAIQRTMARIHVPVTIRGTGYGTARLFRQSESSQPLMLLAALLAIYVVLGVLYESYGQPLTILSTLPSAGLGALLALIVTRTDFSLIAFLGILLLIGIVKKNAIMMVDVALDSERRLGMNARDAIAHACALRFRPIMMTTCAALAGALPLAVAAGEGTELHRPLGISIVGGLVVSQLLTLYTTPVVYWYVRRIGRRRRGGSLAAGRPAEAGA